MSCRVQLANLTLAFRSKNIAALCLPVYVTQDTCGRSLMPDALGLRWICAGIWRNHFHVLQETVATSSKPPTGLDSLDPELRRRVLNDVAVIIKRNRRKDLVSAGAGVTCGGILVAFALYRLRS